MQISPEKFSHSVINAVKYIQLNEGVSESLLPKQLDVHDKYSILVKTIKSESHQLRLLQFRGFYKGVMSPVAGATFVNAIVFGVHGNVIKHITDDPTSLPANFIAGFAAGQNICD